MRSKIDIVCHNRCVGSNHIRKEFRNVLCYLFKLEILLLIIARRCYKIRAVLDSRSVLTSEMYRAALHDQFSIVRLVLESSSRL